MSFFADPFFSIKGQQERLQNVKDVLGISFGFGKDHLVAHTGNEDLNKLVAFSAEHPYVVAAIATAVAAPEATGAVLKTAGQAVLNLAKQNPLAAAGVIATAPFTVTYAVTHPEKVQEGVSDVINAEVGLAELGAHPTLEQAFKFVESHPYVSIAAVAALLGLSLSAFNTAYNSWLTRKSLRESDKNQKNDSSPPPKEVIAPAPAPSSSMPSPSTVLPSGPAVPSPIPSVGGGTLPMSTATTTLSPRRRHHHRVARAEPTVRITNRNTFIFGSRGHWNG
jgi:hypothetical protein